MSPEPGGSGLECSSGSPGPAATLELYEVHLPKAPSAYSFLDPSCSRASFSWLFFHLLGPVSGSPRALLPPTRCPGPFLRVLASTPRGPGPPSSLWVKLLTAGLPAFGRSCLCLDTPGLALQFSSPLVAHSHAPGAVADARVTHGKETHTQGTRHPEPITPWVPELVWTRASTARY